MSFTMAQGLRSLWYWYHGARLRCSVLSALSPLWRQTLWTVCSSKSASSIQGSFARNTPMYSTSRCHQTSWIQTRPIDSVFSRLYSEFTTKARHSISKKIQRNCAACLSTSSSAQSSGILQNSRIVIVDNSKFLPLGSQFFWGQTRCVVDQCQGLFVSHCSLTRNGLQYMTLPGLRVGVRRYTTNTTAAHKPVSPLTVKRPSRKKMPRAPLKEVEEDHGDKVVAYAVAEELNLSQLKEALTIQGLYTVCQLPIDAQDAVHVEARYTVDGKKREIFFFRDGSAVFWCMTEVERNEALKFIRKYDIGRYPQNLILREKEEMDLRFIKGATGVMGDTLQLNEAPDEGHGTLEKYAFSNALAQSVKLAIWEATLETFVDSIEHVTEDLRDCQKIRMSRREVLRKTGELFALRHLINLSSDLLDTPDFYWDRAVLEPLYMAVCNHLDVARRTKVMNEKLQHCCELTELLSSHLNDAHHTRLEVMIIVLIMVEVVFEIIHYIERYVSNQPEEVKTSSPTSDPVTQAAVAPSSVGP